MTEAVLEAPAENESLLTVETAHLITADDAPVGCADEQEAARAERLAVQHRAAGIEPEDNE